MENKILYVDDEYINLYVFQETFKRDFTIVTAQSGAEGLEEIKSHPDIQIVISDMRMPEMSGVEFIKEAKKHLPEAKYFILSGYPFSQDIRQAIDTGELQGFFSKPYKAQTVLDDLKMALEDQ